MSSGPLLKILKKSMLYVTKPDVKLSKGLPNKVTSDSNIRIRQSLVLKKWIKK